MLLAVTLTHNKTVLLRMWEWGLHSQTGLMRTCIGSWTDRLIKKKKLGMAQTNLTLCEAQVFHFLHVCQRVDYKDEVALQGCIDNSYCPLLYFFSLLSFFLLLLLCYTDDWTNVFGTKQETWQRVASLEQDFFLRHRNPLFSFAFFTHSITDIL